MSLTLMGSEYCAHLHVADMTLTTLCHTLELLRHRASELHTRKAYSREDVDHFKVLTCHQPETRHSPLTLKQCDLNNNHHDDAALT